MSETKTALVATSYPPETVLTAQQVWTALQVSRATFERLDLPTIYLGTRTRRYVWGQVLDALKRRAA